MKYIIANWKAHKNKEEALKWAKRIKKIIIPSTFKVIVAPPFPFLLPIKEIIKDNKQIELASQDISRFMEGEYTGEVIARSLKDIVNYTIIGHSERRIFFHEQYNILNKKALNSLSYNIKPIFCINKLSNKVPKGVEYIAFEPLESIGTGKNEDLEDVLQFKNKKFKDKKIKFLYGGSVNRNNILSYLRSKEIDGVLIGKKSLEIKTFTQLLKYVFSSVKR